jgi:hypothetical protein
MKLMNRKAHDGNLYESTLENWLYSVLFALQSTPRTDGLVRNGDTRMLTWDVVECYAGGCGQGIRHIHGIVISKVHAQRHGTNMHCVRYMAMILFQCCSLQNDSKAASFDIQKQLINPLRVVHYLANHVKTRISGYIPYYGENSVCSGNQIL